MPQQNYLITTAIPYANGAPHIGHAYERIATDVMARFARLDGADVLFVTGMDEHGQKMQQTAAREGLTPLALADRTAAQFEEMGDLLNARADDIVRTTFVFETIGNIRFGAIPISFSHVFIAIFVFLTFCSRNGISPSYQCSLKIE